MQGNTQKPDLETLVREAATAMSRTRTVADLDERIGILKEREEVETDRLAAFIVVIPEGYTPDEVALFNTIINEALPAAVKDAMREVEYFQMWGHRSA